MQLRTIQYSTAQPSTFQWRTVQLSTAQMQPSTFRHSLPSLSHLLPYLPFQKPQSLLCLVATILNGDIRSLTMIILWPCNELGWWTAFPHLAMFIQTILYISLSWSINIAEGITDLRIDWYLQKQLIQAKTSCDQIIRRRCCQAVVNLWPSSQMSKSVC